ncbi:hypothetical protein MJO28_008681 [Puccinia striiformis f. sp. tritici]|uniref:Uncharacterized protein n=1 Tax=Puccinia striiformis f. sp. tritici TaxID=168172 RepID=A0ACC0EBA4_9BASI|nr:hypothetical protein MJO28_008681 [Puccinia striiformis f. sp. tritici]
MPELNNDQARYPFDPQSDVQKGHAESVYSSMTVLNRHQESTWELDNRFRYLMDPMINSD